MRFCPPGPIPPALGCFSLLICARQSLARFCSLPAPYLLEGHSPDCGEGKRRYKSSSALSGTPIYALQEARLDSEAARLRRAIQRS